MSKKYSLILFLFIFGMSTCWASESSSLHDKDLAIHTYGGGELLQRVFQSISMLIYGNSKNGLDQTFNGILRIALAIGGFCCICLAFFREKFEPLIKNFFLPAIAIMSCLLVPRTTVYIQDHLAQKAMSANSPSLFKVEHVPFFLGKLASLVSSISHKFTNGLESVAHGVNDQLYDWTGHIYAGENFFLTKKCHIANPVLEDNFREFCRECVYRDLGIGIYSKEDFIHAPNLLQFLEKNTSRIRTVLYRELGVDGKDKTGQSSLIPCRDAIKKMNALFNKDTGNTKDILMGEIGNDFQFLLNQKNSGNAELRKLIKQQISINLLKEEVPGTLNSFASKRAELLQKENQKILGALGANSIVAMRNFFEAVIYMVFPLIILVSLLSFGLKPLLNWVQFVLWVNTWPPFYVVVKFLLNSIWEFRTKHTFGDSFNLTLFTSEGLSDLYSSMESIAAISMAFIPYLSWILLKGGVSQMVHLSSSIMSPAQSAAATTSAEKTYGNYSYGNVNLDNENAYNAQTFRQTYSGFLSTGSLSLDSGTETLTYAHDAKKYFLKQGDSHLRHGLIKTHALNSLTQNSLTDTGSLIKEGTETFAESYSDMSTSTVNFVHSLSQQSQEGSSHNSYLTTSQQESLQYLQSKIDENGHSKTIGENASWNENASGSLGASFGGPFKGIVASLHAGAGGSYQDGVAKSEAYNTLEKTSEAETFQKHLTNILSISDGTVASIMGEEGVKLHQDAQNSFNKTLASSEQLKIACTKYEALSSLKSQSESNSLTVQENLNQQFVQYVYDELGDKGKAAEILGMPNEIPEKQAHIQKFIDNYKPKNPINKTERNLNESYTHMSEEFPKVTPAKFDQRSHDVIREAEQEIGHSSGEIKKEIKTFQSQIHAQSIQDQNHIQSDNARIQQEYDFRKKFSETELKKSSWDYFLEKGTVPKSIKSHWNDLFGSKNQKENKND